MLAFRVVVMRLAWLVVVAAMCANALAVDVGSAGAVAGGDEDVLRLKLDTSIGRELAPPPRPAAAIDRGWIDAVGAVAAWGLLAIVALMALYGARHYYFTLNRLFGAQRTPYQDIDAANWPMVTIMVAAHNEERVIAGSLAALLEVDYPPERMLIMPVNDRSTDRTREIVDQFAARHPDRIRPHHRRDGKGGKAAALREATPLAVGELVVIFDADYLPSRGLVKQLVAPLFDPEVGASMGRVVPQNVGSNLLTRILDLERAGGYQVDQQARMNLGLVPQYGGTVGAVRLKALHEVGGWDDDMLAEDTDLTYRLLLAGWTTAYQNRSECYEEVPETWPVRVRQIQRWARGHNQAMFRHIGRLLAARNLGWRQKLDGAALLGVYVMPPLFVVACALALLLFFLEPSTMLAAALGALAAVSFGALGNFAAFFEIAAAAHMDGSGGRIRLLPLNLLGFVVSAVAISQAAWRQCLDALLRRETPRWHKTERFRAAA